MEADDRSPKLHDATMNFERELEALILSAYGRGAAIEGEWQIHVPLSAAPNWTVEIQKQEDDGERSYEPRFLVD